MPTCERVGVFFHVHRADKRFTPRFFLSHIHKDTRSVPHMTTPHVYPPRILFVAASSVFSTCIYLSRYKLFIPLFPLPLFSLRSIMNTVKGIPAHVLLFCYQHLAAVSFLKWMGNEGGEDGKYADKCRTQRGSHTKRNLQ